MHAQTYIEEVLLFSHVVCIQEHFLLTSQSKSHSNTDLLKKLYGNNQDMDIIPAVKHDNII